MRSIRLLLALVLVLGVSFKVSAQQVTIDLRQVKLETVLDAISQQTGYSFYHSRPTVNPDEIVSLTVKDTALETALDKLFAGTRIGYKINSQKIYLTEKQTSASTTPAQRIKYSGTVLDASKQPVIGVSVMVKGTTTGVSTDSNGHFAIEAPQGAKLSVSFLGYASQEIPLGAKTVLDIVMTEDATQLDNVVVIGYGVMNKRDVSTSISSVKSDAIANVAAPDFRQALAGKMPGVQVIQPSGDPEGSVSIRVRGVSTITAGSEPLYVVDGVPMERGFSNLNNNDIESVEVLKDASSAAIYGSRGSNGVVLITTKRGKSDRVSVQYDGYVGVQTVAKKIAMMDAYQFALAAKDGHDNAYLDANPGGSPDDPNGVRPGSWEKIPTELFPYLNGDQGLTNTDWQDAIFRTAITTSHNISLSGKTQSINYFISTNYSKNEGVVIGSNFDKFSARLNLDGKYKKLKYGINFSPSYSTSNRVDASGAGGVVQSALMMPPVWPVYNDDGSYNYQGNGFWRLGNDYQHNAVMNPVAMARLQSDVVDRMAMGGKVFLEYEFVKGLSYKISVGGDYYGAHNDKYRSSGLPLLGHQYYDQKSNPIGYSSSGFYFNWLVENQITYNTTFKEDHNFNVVLVQSAQKETYKGNTVEATDYPNDYIQTITGGTVTKGSSDKTQWSLASYLARAQYSYKGKYMFSASIRADGSSRFGKNHRWGYFPSASAAWRVSDENFMLNSEALSFIDDLKFRVSYGVTGNFNISNYEHLSLLDRDDYVLGTGNGSLINGYKPSTISNDDLRWEKNKMANAGIDLRMFEGYLGISVDYYNTNTSDMLLTMPVPRLTGFSTTLMNVGKVNNRGWEVLVSSQHNFNSHSGYSFSANYSRNVNEVKALGPGNTPIVSSGSVAHASYITQVGQPIGNYYLLVQDGIFENEDQLKRYPHFDTTRPGDFRFVDVDGDGVLDLDKDRTIVGNYMPDFTYGFGGNVWWKGIDLAFNFQGVYGNEILNLNQRYINSQEGNVNNMVEGIYRWRSESEPGNGNVNRGNRKAKGYNGRTSTWHLEDGSYLRLQNISLGYTLPQAISRKFYVEKLRIYFSGQNLLTWTNYSGYNPEVSVRPTSSITPGEDYGTYPLAKTYTVGLNITF